jgi:D-tyrosyl-tRNA(Tyr) deacylase
MRALIQRVRAAQVEVDNEVVGSCGPGLLIFLGVGTDDTLDNARVLWDKILRLRIFSDAAGKTNLSLLDVGGDVLVISQFTLYADCRKGNRPSFVQAAPAEQGKELYEKFCELAERDVAHVGRGVFGADMQVSLTNDGPFTIWLER